MRTDDMDLETMRYVVEKCHSSRDVWWFIRQYNETYFRELIQTFESRASEHTMLRSEAPWFPRFIRICKNMLKGRMNPEEYDYKPMEQITQCDSMRRVLTIVKAYNNEDFEDWIHCLAESAKKTASR